MHSLTLALDGGKWSASCPGHFTHRERVPSTHWIGGWVGPGTDLYMVSEKNSQPLHWELSPNHLIVQPVASSYTD
jgi:hypothetical protein